MAQVFHVVVPSHNRMKILFAYFRHFGAYDSEETTLNYGGAQYIPTGRGLATSREPFMKSFRCFAPSHMYDALEAGGWFGRD